MSDENNNSNLQMDMDKIIKEACLHLHGVYHYTKQLHDKQKNLFPHKPTALVLPKDGKISQD